jgi:hypothetical protein
MYATAGARVPLELGWVASARGLAHVKLLGFMVSEHDVAALCAAPALEDLSFTAATPAVAARLRECLGDRVALTDLGTDRPAALGVVHGGVTIGLDLAGEWSLETNVEAEVRLRTLLATAAPALARAVEYDTESSAVWIVAPDRATLDAVLALVAAETARR